MRHPDLLRHPKWSCLTLTGCLVLPEFLPGPLGSFREAGGWPATSPRVLRLAPGTTECRRVDSHTYARPPIAGRA